MKNKNKLIVILIIVVVILLLLVGYLFFFREKTYTITLDSNGGSEVPRIEVKNGEIVKLPDAPKKEGHTFVGWSNKEGKIITSGSKISEDLTLKAEWISDSAEKNEVVFDTDGLFEIENIVVLKDGTILLPVDPVREGYIFIGWINEEGKLINENMIVDKNMVFKALWISVDAETVSVSFDTDGGNLIDSIVIEKGKILLPINPTKEGYVFAGWVDSNGNSVNSDTILSENMTIKALWKEPYTCPKDCTPSEDGKTCTKVVTTSLVKKTTCPSGSTLYTPWYNSSKTVCIKLSTKVDANIRQCDTWDDAEVDYKDSKGKSWCVKTVSKKTTKVCPSGYTKSGDICKKTKTVNCTAN